MWQRVKRGVIMDFEIKIEKIARDIADRRDKEMALDFTEHDNAFEDKIELLNRNLNLQKDKRCETETERNYLAERFNQLKDENDELKQRIAELDSNKTPKLPFNPLETANMLINATYKMENCMTGAIYDKDVYDIDDLEQIAEHLLVYCKHNKESEE